MRESEYAEHAKSICDPWYELHYETNMFRLSILPASLKSQKLSE
jgi:hypothetical protein